MPNPTMPAGANSTEVLQGVVRRVYNKWVRDWFQDVDALDELDLSVPRHSAYAACLHQDNDSLIVTTTRQKLFDDLRGRLTTPLVGETVLKQTVVRANRPKIILYFQEDFNDTDPDYAPVSGQVGFRLMDETAESLTEAKLKQLATKIKSVFGRNNGYIWRKGKLMVSYTHWEEGYQLQILCKTKDDGKELVKDILSLQGKSPQWEYLNVNENEAPMTAYPTSPGQQRILGKTQKIPRRRPIADVRFQYASISTAIHPNPMALYDRSGTWGNTLIN